MLELFAQVEVPREVAGVPLKYLMYAIGGGALGLAAVLFVFKLLFGKKKSGRQDPERGLEEFLEDFPPPPAEAGSRRLTVNGIPTRIRLIVVAPAGKAQNITPEQIPGLLEKITPGIGAVIRADRPRLRVWPAQMSLHGFSPKFMKHVTAPEDEDRWVLLCGPARVGPRPVLVGMALLADEAAYQEPLEMEPEDWRRMIRVEKM